MCIVMVLSKVLPWEYFHEEVCVQETVSKRISDGVSSTVAELCAIQEGLKIAVMK